MLVFVVILGCILSQHHCFVNTPRTLQKLAHPDKNHKRSETPLYASTARL